MPVAKPCSCCASDLAAPATSPCWAGWVVGRCRWRSLVPAALRTSGLRRNVFVLGGLRSGDAGGEALSLLRFGPRRLRDVFVLGGLRSGDAGGEALSLLRFGPRRLRDVFVLGGLRSGDAGGEALSLLLALRTSAPQGRLRARWAGCGREMPVGEALFLLRFGARGPGRRLGAGGGLWSGDAGGEALFLLHLGPRGASGTSPCWASCG